MKSNLNREILYHICKDTNILYYTLGESSHKLLDSPHIIVSKIMLAIKSDETL